MGSFRRAARMSELKSGEVKGVAIDGDAIALYRLEEQVFATSDACSHQKCSLEEFGTVIGQEVECMCHTARFNIRTGEATRPPAVKPRKIYKVKLEGDDVLVEV